jgi:flagellar basal-body rod modification protein FlgD
MNIQGYTPDPTAPTATAKATGASNGSSTQSATGSLDVSFLNLLITELKTQDPTSPMDATQMVGQMVSLNQLDQLIAIHQILQGPAGATGAASNAKGAN